MFPIFIGILDIQSWWEVPSIAHFCSLFRDAFNLLDFDIEDLEEALLTDGGTENQLLQELIVRLLEGCLPDDTRNDISIFNYQMFLRRLFRKKCQEYNCKNPFNTDVDFELLPLRQKVEILRALCDFRLDTKDVEESLSDLDSDCLRVEPLGHDSKNSAYWYFYGTRLYREDYIKSSNFISQKQKGKPREKKHKRHRNRLAKKEEEEKKKEEDIVYRNENKNKESIWQVVCFTLQDWSRLVEKFKDSEYATERKLYRALSEDFMPEIPKLFDLKEKQQRRKILQHNSIRIVQNHISENIDNSTMVKSKIKSKTNKIIKRSVNQISKTAEVEEEVIPPPIQKKGRQTNNSLASAVGQIVIDTRDEIKGAENRKYSGKDGNSVSSGYGCGYNFGIEEEEQQIGMHKVLKILKDHEDAWPFIDPVDEQYAPKYYSVVRHPMDLSTMEDKLEDGFYKTISQFKRDFRLIIDNCKQYNGSDNEYTEMAINLKEAFNRAVDRYLESEQSSDDSLSISSDIGVNFLSYKNKISSQSAVRHSQRYRHLRKLNKKTKFNAQINKKRTRQQVYDDFVKEESEIEINTTKIKDIEQSRKIKKCKNEVKAQKTDMKQKNENAIFDTNVINSKNKKSDNSRTISKNKNILIREKNENELIKINKKIKTELRQNNELLSTKELKENRKRKDNFEDDYDSNSILKSKKFEKIKSKESDILIDKSKKGKIKKIESQVKLIENNEKLFFSSGKGKKISKINKEKSKLPGKSNDKKKHKKSIKKGEKLVKNSKVKQERDMKKNENITNISKKTVRKLESLITNKDIESLDSLKDRISERRREEKLKLEQEKKKKQSFKINDFHGTFKKVPSNGSTYNHNVEKLGSKKLISKNLIKEEKNSENRQSIDEYKPKKVKTSYSKPNKGSGRGDPTIQALNQATEQTLNDINKWLDDTPKLSELSSDNDLPVLHTLSSNSSKLPSSTHSTVAATLTTVVVTGITATDVSSRKRPSSVKLFGTYATIRPKKVQRTINRLQPGKSKGNLLSKKLPTGESSTSNDITLSQSIVDNNQANRELNNEPKLSLGTVLKNVDSIQLICKSLVSSPNPNLSNDDDEESVSKSAIALLNTTEEQPMAIKKIILNTSKDVKIEKRIDNEETQKQKSTTPNLSAWFKAFGITKLKKKEEEITSFSVSTKRELILEASNLNGTRQRRISAGGSSLSESVSSFSQESPPSRTDRSPHQNQQTVSMLTSPASIEPQVQGAGFYQDALSTGSSPYNSPYYTTPPRYSAQLPPTPSPQNHPLSPAYSSLGNFEQNALQLTVASNLYSQLGPQTSHQSFKSSSQTHSPIFTQQSSQSCLSQNSLQGESQQPNTAPMIAATAQNQSSVYPQLLPQTKSSTSRYSQSCTQVSTSSYSQPSQTQTSSLNFSQSSTQQQPSPYSQSSPQPPTSFSQTSPQSQQHSSYSQPSPQQSNFSQVSPRPSSSTFSQPSPQPSCYTAQTPSPYSQPDLVIAQLSPQAQGYLQTSPQLPNYSQSLSETPSPYSTQQTPQQQAPTYSQPSPQTPPSYSQSSPQQSRSYSLSSPQQTSQQSSVSNALQSQNTNFSQPLNQQQSQQNQHQSVQAIFKTTEAYDQNLSITTFTQPLKSTYQQSSITTLTSVVKPTATKEKQENTDQHLTTLNHQIYQSASSSQYASTYVDNVISTSDRVSNQLINELSTRSATRLTNHETCQIQQNQDQQPQLLNFQQNLTSHESLYSSGFQTTPYPMSNVSCRSVYPGYFDTNAKGTSSSGNSLTPVKKRLYNEPSTLETSTQRSSSQDQFSFDSLIPLAHSQSDVSVAVSNQFDSTFANSLNDPITSNPAYTRLQLGLVARTNKDSQQLLSIPRTTGKNDPLIKYGRTTTSNQSEVDLNLLQSLQNAAAKNSNILSKSRRVSEQQSSSPTKLKKNKKSKQQPINIIMEQQTNISSFSQYSSTTNDPIGLKQTSISSNVFNFVPSTNTTNNSAFYDKETSASAAAAAYAFLDDFRNPNLPSYYSMALRQQQQVQQQQQQQTQLQQVHQQSTSGSDVVQEACNKLSNQSTTRSYSGHSFLHSTQRPTPYRPPVPPYVTPHAANLGVDPAAYQQYLHSLYALQPPPHHRPTWL